MGFGQTSQPVLHGGCFAIAYLQEKAHANQ